MTNITIATDENYAPHVAALMASIFVNSPSHSINIYLLADSLTDNTKEKLKQLAKNFSVYICIIEGNVENFYTSDHLSKAAYLRLKIPELLPKSVSRALYLDADLLVKCDIAELFNFDIQNKPLAAVPDLGIMASKRSMREKSKTLGIDKTAPYFNSGVIIMDLEKWRANDYTNKLLELVKTHNFRHHDQDALNMLFYNNWYALPFEYNLIPPVFELPIKTLFSKYRKDAINAIKNAKIIHYAGGHKPWHYKKTANLNEYYYEMLSLTPFEIPEPQEKTFRKYRELARIRRGQFLASIL